MPCAAAARTAVTALPFAVQQAELHVMPDDGVRVLHERHGGVPQPAGRGRQVQAGPARDLRDAQHGLVRGERLEDPHRRRQHGLSRS
jgi:hypothetical protein